jgi:hypothetical protein
MFQPPITVVETPTFKNDADNLLDEEERLELITTLARNPEAGKVMPGTGGVRKLRFARAHEGKSGGYRVIYYFYNEDMPLFALMLYPKNAKCSLTQGERNALKQLARELIEAYHPR